MYVLEAISELFKHPFVIAISVTVISAIVLTKLADRGKAAIQELTQKRLTQYQHLHARRANICEAIYIQIAECCLTYEDYTEAAFYCTTNRQYVKFADIQENETLQELKARKLIELNKQVYRLRKALRINKPFIEEGYFEESINALDKLSSAEEALTCITKSSDNLVDDFEFLYAELCLTLDKLEKLFKAWLEKET